MHRALRWALSSRRLAAVTACVLAAAAMTADPASAAGGVLGGVVTDATTGAPVADVQVSVLKIVTDHGGQTTQVVTSANTDADGRYSATGIPAGKAYKVELSRDGYVDEYSHD
ncbi:MAG: Carboxypeptidase regulatory-like domain, partial [Cryptosporangiaceae bacterium]|nr:Carboxypeptidase regulatory-like domain [Cryptosporangiaceae bacterium]